jgi:predicted ATPase
MIQPSNGNGKQTRGITNSARNMGVYVLGGRGTGKSWLLALVIAWQDFLAGRPQVIF